jgi:hypothetical protein
MKQDRINEYPIPKTMKAWARNPEELALVEKPVPVPQPGAAEVLVRVDAIAVCATDIEIIKQGCRRWSMAGCPSTGASPPPGHEHKPPDEPALARQAQGVRAIEAVSAAWLAASEAHRGKSAAG